MTGTWSIIQRGVWPGLILILALAPAFVSASPAGADQSPATEAPRNSVTIIYQSDVLGQIDPCT